MDRRLEVSLAENAQIWSKVTTKDNQAEGTKVWWIPWVIDGDTSEHHILGGKCLEAKCDFESVKSRLLSTNRK